MKQYLPFRKTALAFAFGFTGLTASAQTPVIQWDKTFGGNSIDVLTSLVHTSDGGYLIGGSSESGISGDKTQANKGFLGDYWILKLDAVGNKQWDKTIGGAFDDGLRSMAQLSNGGFILGGISNSPISGDKTQPASGGSDYWIVVTDPAGNKIWDKVLGGSGLEALNSLSRTADGGYIIGGTSDSGISGDKTQASQGSNDYWIVKLDPNGNKLWDKTYGGSASEYLHHISQTADGGYIAGGISDSGISGDKTQASRGSNDYWVLKLDANGNKIWDKAFGGNNSDMLFSLAQTADGGYILGGNSGSGISGDKTQAVRGGEDFWVIKTDAAGNKQWDKTIGGSAADNLRSLARTADGGYVLGGISASGVSGDKTQPLNGINDYWMVKLDGTGAMTWDKSIGGSNNNWLISLYQTTPNSYILAGMSDSGISGNKTQVNQGNWDYWMVKLNVTAPTGISEAGHSFKAIAFPNPNRGAFRLALHNIAAETAGVTVSDLLCRIVYQQQIPVTGKQLSHEISLPRVKGLYLLQVKAGEETITRKIVVE